MQRTRVYLDHAATSFPKPTVVTAAVQRWFDELGVSAERGDGPACAEVAAVVAATRRRIGALCGMPADRVAFTSGATEALNLFLRGFLSPGDCVVTTALEHSAVARPLRALADERGLRIEVLAAASDGRLPVEDVARALRGSGASLLVFSHASNVTGAVLDAAGLCAAARQVGCVSLVDASQTAGLLPLDVGADALVASAHKALLAPPGLGFLAVRPGLVVRPQKQGGTGSAAAIDVHPDRWPEAMEAGTPNTPAIFGLHAALEAMPDSAATLRHGIDLVDGLRARLEAIEGARVLGPRDGERVPVLSFTLTAMDPAEVGIGLAEAGIHVRTGFHCAPWVHADLGTEVAGTIRISPGPTNTIEDVLRVAQWCEAACRVR